MNDTQLALLLICCAVLGFFLLLSVALKLKSFSMELRYLNQEIARSTGKEKRRWLRRRRRLFLSLLPFVKY